MVMVCKIRQLYETSCLIQSRYLSQGGGILEGWYHDVYDIKIPQGKLNL